MINFLNNWVEQITISVIIVSIFELILPKGNLKKYIKIVLGVYIIFCIISPFVNDFKWYDIENIDFNKYSQNITENKVNQESMDTRLQELYIEELKRNITEKVKENGYNVSKCDIKANLTEKNGNVGINNINLVVSKGIIEKVEINSKDETKNQNNEEIEKIKEEIAKTYEINKNTINIKIK